MIDTNIYEDIEAGNMDKVKKAISELHPSDIAEIINHLSADDKIKLFSILDTDTA